MKSYVNLGCGGRLHEDWTNLDLVPRKAGVLRADLSKGIPLKESYADLVYHSAVLEHIRREDVPRFLSECLRVLKTGGVLRIAVPDFERLCLTYLQVLERVSAGDRVAGHDHEWLMLEFADQMVREWPGGGMREYLASQRLPNLEFVFGRIGDEGRELIANLRAAKGTNRRRISLSRLPHYVARAVTEGRRALASLLLTRHERRALRIGLFRLSGEVHQWIYDRHSLARVLLSAGFERPTLCQATTSAIDHWADISLDVGVNGRPVKPDLFYMAAGKPAMKA
jgi:SAM-dependent methyltransferase